MDSKTLSRRSKALTLVPLALISGVWTASLVSSSADATAAASTHKLPDGTQVPSKAIQAPASVPVPGEIAPAVPSGAADSVVSGISSNGIPAPALTAYQRAAQIIDAADKTCNISWQLIAAIGRVESDHGRYDGNTLTPKGISTPGIFGPELNGKNGTQAVPDTDGGQLDHDTVFDRAVGPMQFIPSTWRVVQVDADNDGQKNPQDINDASLATAVYLCSGNENLANRAGQESAVFRYNHSQDYVNLVLRIAEAYASGDFTALPSGTSGGSSFSSSGYSSAINQSYQAAQQKAKAKAHAQKVRQQQAVSGGSTSSSTGSSTSSGGGITNGGSSGGGTLPSGSGSGSNLGNTLGNVVKGGTSVISGGSSPSPSPVIQTLGFAAAQSLCAAQINGLATALNPLPNGADTTCANKVKDMTQAQALAAIPNTLVGVLAWL